VNRAARQICECVISVYEQTILSRIGWRGAEKPFDQIGQRSYFAISQYSGPTGNGKAGREGADKDGPIADRRTNVFAEGDKFFDQLLTFKSSAR
jgi:hypothetical protein